MRALWHVVCISLGLFLGPALGPAIAGAGTAPDKASAPYPVQGKTSVPLYLKQLAWTGNGDAYDVRLDTENPPVTLVSRDQVGTSYLLPGPLQGGAVYYWRVDAKNEAGATTGDVWSFTASSRPPVARWDVVPDQKFSTPINVGVPAFHESGVEAVDFYVGGVLYQTAKEPQFNGESGVVEYFISLDPADCLDGPLAIGATVIPKDKGCESRVLEDITLYANSGGTLSNAEVMWCDATVGDDA